jgi:hypothetical protein
VEQAFGMLQAHFAIIKNPGCLWNNDDFENIMIMAIIIHNMIIKDKRDSAFENMHDYHLESSQTTHASSTSSSQHNSEMFLLQHQAIRSRLTQQMLKEDMINHLWNKHGTEDDDSDKGSKEDT